MKRTYTTARYINADVVTLDEHGAHIESVPVLEITLTSLNPDYTFARSLTRDEWRQFDSLARQHGFGLPKLDASTIGRRAAMQERIALSTDEDGWVGIFWRGRDCDGQDWSRSYAMPSHMLRLIEKYIDADCDALDGPASYCFGIARGRDVFYSCEQYGYTLPE